MLSLNIFSSLNKNDDSRVVLFKDFMWEAQKNAHHLSGSLELTFSAGFCVLDFVFSTCSPHIPFMSSASPPDAPKKLHFPWGSACGFTFKLEKYHHDQSPHLLSSSIDNET